MLMSPAANLRLGQDKAEIWILLTDHRSTRIFKKMEFISWPLREMLQRSIRQQCLFLYSLLYGIKSQLKSLHVHISLQKTSANMMAA